MAPPAANYQRLDVNESASASAIGNAGALTTENIADLNQSANNSFIVQGSMSSALGIGPQNDWGMGPPGGPGMMSMGGAGMSGPGSEGQNVPGMTDQTSQDSAGGGR